MPVSEKQKQYARKWDKENMRSISCRMRTDEAEDFKKWCTINKTTPGTELKNYVWKRLEEYYQYLENLEKQQKGK
ncbi:MAG: hypothetical protein MSH60_11185 [Ruminococcus sp.]|nr:hypothetical protein [Ruminococcus sp.]